MNIALIGVTGRVGSRLLAELLRRGHKVTGIARHPEKLPRRDGLTLKQCDINDETALAAAVAGHDAVISAFNFTSGNPAKFLAALKKAGAKRLLMVGGAGSLEVAPGLQLIDSPGFPPEYKAEATAGRLFLEALRKERELDWTFLSPQLFFEPGTRTGAYRLGTDQLLKDAKGESRISMEDFSIALVDELEKPAHSRKRFTAGY
jgi:putative NADH-flavin reductase